MLNAYQAMMDLLKMKWIWDESWKFTLVDVYQRLMYNEYVDDEVNLRLRLLSKAIKAVDSL